MRLSLLLADKQPYVLLVIEKKGITLTKPIALFATVPAP